MAPAVCAEKPSTAESFTIRIPSVRMMRLPPKGAQGHHHRAAQLDPGRHLQRRNAPAGKQGQGDDAMVFWPSLSPWERAIALAETS